MSEKYKSTGGKCVSETSTVGNLGPGATRTSRNPFESSRSEKPQYFVALVKDKRTKNNSGGSSNSKPRSFLTWPEWLDSA